MAETPLGDSNPPHEVQGPKLSEPQKPSSQSRAPPRNPPKWRRLHRLCPGFPFDLHRRRPYRLFPFNFHRRRPHRIFQGPSQSNLLKAEVLGSSHQIRRPGLASPARLLHLVDVVSGGLWGGHWARRHRVLWVVGWAVGTRYRVQRVRVV